MWEGPGQRKKLLILGKDMDHILDIKIMNFLRCHFQCNVVIGVFKQIKYNVNFIHFKFHNILTILIFTYNSTSIG